MQNLMRILEGAAVLIGLFLLVQNADGFSQVAKALGDFSVSQTKALQGR